MYATIQAARSRYEENVAQYKKLCESRGDSPLTLQDKDWLGSFEMVEEILGLTKTEVLKIWKKIGVERP